MKRKVNILYRRNFILLILLIISILVQTASCKKFLDKKSSSRLAIISNVGDLQALLDRNAWMNNGTVPEYGEGSSDDYFLTLEKFNAPRTLGGQLGYTWQYFFDLGNQNDWERGYNPINIANICLEEIEKLPKTADNGLEWNNVKGSAFFFRAFSFLNLSWTYSKAYDSATSGADLGIVLRFKVDNHVPTGPTVRATVAQCYRQVISDAKQSIDYLPVVAVHPLRPSVAAAYGLLSRAYLSMRLYDSAFKYADLFLALRNELMDYNGDADIPGAVTDFSSPFRQYNKETVFYANMPADFLYFSIVQGNVDTSLYAMYDDNDIRKQLFFRSDVNGYQQFKGFNGLNGIDYFGGIATDEIYLIRAECYARKDMISAAMNDLNTLMIKRWKNNGTWAPFTASSTTEALNKILVERRKELLFRGLRWMDIKRLNKEGAGITLTRDIDGQLYELLPNSDKYALPIPEDIIQLTGIPQNTGWL